MIKLLFPWFKWNGDWVARSIIKFVFYAIYIALNSAWLINSWNSPNVTKPAGFIVVCAAFALVAILPFFLYMYGARMFRWLERNF